LTCSAGDGFKALGVLYLLIRIGDYYFPHYDFNDPCWFFAVVILSIIYVLWESTPYSQINISLPSTISKLKIKFGDIFEGDGLIVIPVNEFFDSEIGGGYVSENSLHGKFILQILNGDSVRFNGLVDESLKDLSPPFIKRTGGRRRRYPIGTVVKMDINGIRYLLVALSRTDTTTLKASATLEELITCLQRLWEAVRNYSEGACVKVPLIGSGLSGVGLPYQDLIHITRTSLLEATKEKQVTDEIILVINPIHKAEIDLNLIKERWL